MKKQYSKLLLISILSVLIIGCGKPSTRKTTENSRTEAVKQVDSTSAEQINVDLGVGYLQRGKPGDLDIALEKFKRAVLINPKFSLAHSMLATVYDRKGLFDSAEKHYKLSIKYNNGSPDIINNYANFLCQRGKYQEAVDKYLEVVKNSQYKTPAAAYENAGVCSYRANNEEQAEKYFRMALQENKTQPNSLYYLLKISLNKQEFMKSRAFLQRLEQVIPASEEMLISGYKIENGLGNTKLATNYLTKLQKKFPKSDFLKIIN